MDAIMQSLLGGDALTDDDKMRQTADALRNSKRAADFFSMSTVKPLSQMANRRSQDIMDAAERGGRARQIGLEKMRSRKQREDDLAREEAQRKQDRENTLSDNAAKIASDERIAKMKLDAQGRKNPMSMRETENYRVALNSGEELDSIIKGVEANPEAFGVTVTTAGLLPDGTANIIRKPIQGWDADNLTPEQGRARAALLRQAYDYIHKLAGTAVSAQEKKDIEAFVPNQNSTYQDIIDKMTSAKERADRVTKSYERFYGLDPRDYGYGGDQNVRQEQNAPASAPGNAVEDYSNATDEDLLNMTKDQLVSLPNEVYDRYEKLIMSNQGE